MNLAAEGFMSAESKKWAKPVPALRRLPGQSLRERWQSLVDDRLVQVVFGPMMIWAVVLGVWIGSTTTKPSLWFWFLCAIVATGVAVIKYLRLIRQARALIRGERGERFVGEQLEELQALGFHCFHDIVRDGFNIDHAVVGPAGVYAIETKYRSGSGWIEFKNGQGLFVGDREEEKDSLQQARGNARALHDLIREHAGLDVWVRPLVVFVGDWKVKNSWRDTDAQVMTAEYLGRYFDGQDQPDLMPNEIRLICSHLNRTARAV